MSAAELLLKRLVEQAGGGAETGYVLVIDGEGLEGLSPQVPTPQATYGIHRARTELGLRHLLWQARGAPIIAVLLEELARRIRQARGAPIIAALPEELARRIRQAPDLLRRARNQRVHSLQVTDMLEVALGVRVVGAEPPWLQQLALDHVDRLTEEMRRRTLPTVVDRPLLTELLIDACVGEQVRSRTPAEQLAGWVRGSCKKVSYLTGCDEPCRLPNCGEDEGYGVPWLWCMVLSRESVTSTHDEVRRRGNTGCVACSRLKGGASCLAHSS